MIQLERIAEAANNQATVMQAVRNVLTYRTMNAIWNATYRELRGNVTRTRDATREEVWSHENDRPSR